MIFDTNQWKSYADLHLRLYRVTDEQGEVFLLLSGPEPDVQWERVAAALLGLIEQLGVRLTVSVHGIPMAVPHTRPITLTAHATDTDLVQGYRSWIDRVEVPAASPDCWSSGSVNATARPWASPPTSRTTWPRRVFPRRP